MKPKSLTAPLVVATLALSACSDRNAAQQTSSGTPPNASAESDGSRTPTPTPTMVSPVDSPDGVNDGYPDLTPPTLTEQAAKGEKGARNILLSWARAIELKEFDQAWSLMSEADHTKWSKRDFADIFADLGKITVAIPGGEMEGAAGSSYYTSHATITANDKDGRPVRIEGPVVLKRVNDVPGASPEQLRWHIESTELTVTH